MSCSVTSYKIQQASDTITMPRLDVARRLQSIAGIDFTTLTSNDMVQSSLDFLKQIKAQLIENAKDLHLVKVFNAALHNLPRNLPETIEFPKPIAILSETKAQRYTFLDDYRPPKFLIPDLKLHFIIGDDCTTVGSKMTVRRNHAVPNPSNHLVLHGEKLDLLEVKINGHVLNIGTDFEVNDRRLKIFNPPKQDTFDIELTTRFDPLKNTEKAGLYEGSKGLLNTHCEPEGFRRMTYFLDRPDVMPRITTAITANKEKYPTLLCNGNEVSREINEAEGTHTALFVDPHPKPTYLFALLAGNMRIMEDTYQSPDKSEKPVKIRAFVEKGNEERVQYAIHVLKSAMEWDERTFGRKYDLEVLNIVAIPKFPIGAMENKGCLFFNSGDILCSPETATDDGYKRIATVVAHEYFHNWTGNRVTILQWLYLFFKEGLTTFRENLFSEEFFSKDLQRIDTVRFLRRCQFPEDSGPMAHPVLRDFVENKTHLYTYTTYSKGAEIFRLIYILLGQELFRKGMDLYFARNDGKAATAEDFLQAMSDASGLPQLFEQFRQTWLKQAGTPEVTVKMTYDKHTEVVRFDFTQTCPPTPECKEKKPFVIPVILGLLSPEGEELIPSKDTTFFLTKASESFEIANIPEKPIPSLFRGFSAPVKVNYDYSIDDLAFQLRFDSDPFNRYEASNRLNLLCLHKFIKSYQDDKSFRFKLEDEAIFKKVASLYEEVLGDEKIQPDLKAELLTMPSVAELVEELPFYDFEAAFAAREAFRKYIATKCEAKFVELAERYEGSLWTAAREGKLMDSSVIAQRSLRNVCLQYLSLMDNAKHIRYVLDQYHNHSTLTDKANALQLLCNLPPSEIVNRFKKICLENFHQLWNDDPVKYNEAINQCFRVQTSSTQPLNLEHLEGLLKDKAFDWSNTSRLNAFFFGLLRNPQFHEKSGKVYEFFCNKLIEIARVDEDYAGSYLGEAFFKYSRLPEPQKGLLRAQMERILAQGFKGALAEVLNNTLKEK